MNQIKTVCVYCGSGPGTNPRFVEAAQALGKIFAQNHIRLVYGGGSVGLMGAIAKSALDHDDGRTQPLPILKQTVSKEMRARRNICRPYRESGENLLGIYAIYLLFRARVGSANMAARG